MEGSIEGSGRGDSSNFFLMWILHAWSPSIRFLIRTPFSATSSYKHLKAHTENHYAQKPQDRLQSINFRKMSGRQSVCLFSCGRLSWLQPGGQVQHCLSDGMQWRCFGHQVCHQPSVGFLDQRWDKGSQATLSLVIESLEILWTDRNLAASCIPTGKAV